MTVKDITEAVENTTAAAADLATGAAVGAVEVITRPGRAAGRLERKGAPARKQAHRDIVNAADGVRETTQQVAGALLPERIALRGLSLVKARARRVDLVGELAFRGLDLFHGSLKDFGSAITRLERASEPPARPQRSLGRAARTTASETRTSAKRTTKSAARTTKTAARRTSRTRRTTRRATTA